MLGDEAHARVLCQEEEKVDVSRVPEQLHKVPVEQLFDYIAKQMITWSEAQGWCALSKNLLQGFPLSASDSALTRRCLYLLRGKLLIRNCMAVHCEQSLLPNFARSRQSRSQRTAATMGACPCQRCLRLPCTGAGVCTCTGLPHIFLCACSAIAERHRPVLGFCFSFPVDHQALDAGTLIQWTKGFENPGGVGADPAKLLRQAFERQARSRRQSACLCMRSHALAPLCAHFFICMYSCVASLQHAFLAANICLLLLASL